MLATGTTDTITIDQVIASAKVDLGLMSSIAYDVHLEKWINEGAGPMGLASYYQYVKKPAILTVQNNRATLPRGFVRYLGLRFHTQSQVTNPDGSVTTETVCSPILYVDRVFVEECGCNPMWNGLWNNYQPTFQIVGNEIVFFSHVEDGTEVQLSFIGYATGDDCLYLLHPDFERALSAYARMKFHQAFPEVKGNLAPMLMQEAKKEWIAQKQRVRGMATLNEFQTKRYQIVNLAKAWFTVQTIN